MISISQVEKKFVIKTTEGQYWKEQFPNWVSNINNVTPLTFEVAQDKLEDLELEVDFRLRIEPLEQEYKNYRDKYYNS